MRARSRRHRRSRWGRAALPALGLLLAALAVSADPEPEQPATGPEAAVVLHGLGRSDRAMAPLAARLSRAGYAVHNLDYPSTELPPEELDAYLHDRVTACCRTAPRLHFVTHSLGGILVRAYLHRHETPNLGRVVMLAPPNRGSELVDLLDSAPFRWALGPTASQLGTGEESLPNRLPPPDYEVGVIAGTRSVNPLGSLVLPGESDGTVTVRNTRLDGMADFVTVPASHTFIMRSDLAGRQVVEFLRRGKFRPELLP